LLWAIFLLVLVAPAFYFSELLAAAVAKSPSPKSAASVDHGQVLWKQYCEVCHGADGRGDGQLTASLPKRPKDLTRIALPPVFPDGILAYRIANGGEVMPAWKTALSSQDTWDLVYFIRSKAR
jgi:mono/diheme cytochrome c family protein